MNVINFKHIWQGLTREQQTFLKRSLIAIIGWISLDSIISIDNYLTNFVSYGAETLTNIFTNCSPKLIIQQVVTNSITINKISLIGCNTNIAIGHACNGKAIIYLYSAFILATTQHNVRRKLIFCITGVIAIMTSNILRIAALFIIKKNAPIWFDIAHKNIFQLLMYAIIILLWLMFLQKKPNN